MCALKPASGESFLWPNFHINVFSPKHCVCARGLITMLDDSFLEASVELLHFFTLPTTTSNPWNNVKPSAGLYHVACSPAQEANTTSCSVHKGPLSKMMLHIAQTYHGVPFSKNQSIPILHYWKLASWFVWAEGKDLILLCGVTVTSTQLATLI